MSRVAKHALDELGLVAAAYDAKARLRYLGDRSTRARNARLRSTGAPDRLPLPPPHLVYLVAGHFDLAEYYETGRFHAEFLRRVLDANGFDLARFRSLLDFGCGCGRVIRHWQSVAADVGIHGSDYNRRLAAWCREAFPFAEFAVNGLAPPLRYATGAFEFVYAISVFTHLTESLQHAWIRELERVLAPDGVLLITTKGSSRIDALTQNERARFERGELVVTASRYAGRNLCAAYHPERYVRDRLADGLRVLDFVPAGADGTQTQDVFLLQKAGGRRPLRAPLRLRSRVGSAPLAEKHARDDDLKLDEV
jgi:SAM-dependent methyltransferase